MLTLKEVESSLPPSLKSSVTQHLVDTINNIASNVDEAEMIRNNFISYTTVLKDGKFKTEDYLNAVMYVSYKLLGNSNLEAWCKVFPHRYQRLVQAGTPAKDISAHVSAYNKGRLVNLIIEQSLVPSWVLNQDVYQKAINVQAELMLDPDVSAKVRSDAANSLLTHLKKPEGKDFQIKLDVQDNSGMNELKEALSKMANAQQELIRSGTGIKQITESVIIENGSHNGVDKEGT